MKNSKLLSLLTAGALVVSSFSGLAMNGGVALAASVTKWAATQAPDTAAVTLKSVTYWAGAATAANTTTSAYTADLELNKDMGYTVASARVELEIADPDNDDTFDEDDAWVAALTPAVTELTNTGVVTAPTTLAAPSAAVNTALTTAGYTDAGAGKVFYKRDATAEKVSVVYYTDITLDSTKILKDGNDYIQWGTATNANKVTGTIKYTVAGNKVVDSSKGTSPAADNKITATIGSGTISESLTLTYYFKGADLDAAKGMATANVNKALGAPVVIAGTGSGFADDTVAKTYSANSKLGSAFGALGYSVTYTVPFSINTDVAGLRDGDTVTVSFPYGLDTGANASISQTALTYTVTFKGAGASNLAFNVNNDIALTDTEVRDGVGRILARNNAINDTIKIRKVSGASLLSIVTANVIDSKDAVIARALAGNYSDRIFVTAESDDERIIRARGYQGTDDATQKDSVLLTPVGIGSANVRAKIWVVTDAQLTERCIGVTPWYNVEVIPAIDEVRIYNGKVQIEQFADLDGTNDSITLTGMARNDFFGYVGDVKWAWASDNDYVKVEVNDDNSVTVSSIGNGSLDLYAVSEYNLAWDAAGAYGATTKAKIDAGKEASRTTNYLYAIGYGVNYPFQNAYTSTIVSSTDFGPGILLEKGGDVDVTREGYDFQIKLVAGNKPVDVVARTNTTWLVPATTASRTGIKFSVASANETVATVSAITNKNKFSVTPVSEGTATVTVTGEYLDGTKTVTLTRDLKVIVGNGGDEPTPDTPQPGELVKEDGVTGVVNEDGETVTVTDVTVVSKAITIPETVDGLKVTAVAPQAFKKTNAKTVYVVGSVEELGKGAFKASKVKKVFFYDPAALKTVGKNAFKKTDAKVVGVGAAFSDDAAKQLKKAGAKSVKNNGTAK